MTEQAIPTSETRLPPQGKLPALALTALGIVFGDIGTSPLYTFKTVLSSTDTPTDPATVLGALSLVLAALTAGPGLADADSACAGSAGDSWPMLAGLLDDLAAEDEAALAVPWFCGPARWNITTMASFCTVPKPNP